MRRYSTTAPRVRSLCASHLTNAAPSERVMSFAGFPKYNRKLCAFVYVCGYVSGVRISHGG